MRIIWPIVFCFFIVAISFVLLDTGVSLMWIGIVLPLFIPFVFSSSYKSLQSTVLDSAAADENTHLFDDIRVINGAAVINRSGMGFSYDSKNPITFLTTSTKGIDGAITLEWGNMKAFEKNGDSVVRLELKKYFRFFNTTEVDIQFKSDADAVRFYQEAVKQIAKRVRTQ